MDYIKLDKILANVSSITTDSSKVKKKSIYVALIGKKFDGHDFIDQAFSMGASYVIGTKEFKHKNYFKVTDVNKLLALLSRAIYKNQPQNIVAVTGTNGKSSSAHFFKQLSELSGHKSASLGTLGVSGFESESSLTTPTADNFFRILHEAHEHNIYNMAIEASSHGLKLNRIDGVCLRAASFTNLTHDHLDFHKSMDEYFKAKSYLFTDILKEGIAVLNRDSNYFDRLEKICNQHNHQIITYGYDELSDLRINNITANNFRSNVHFTYQNKSYSVSSDLIGSFQIENLLNAIGLAIACGMSIEKLVKFIPSVKAVPGRMELIICDERKALVDYAHTEDAIKNVLLEIRKYCVGRIICVFGVGGDRDKDKRKTMAQTADELADIVIITDDNPRTEDPSLIRRELVAYCNHAIEIENREEAIRNALELANKNDIVVILGKGHETNFLVNDKVIEYQGDKKVVEEYFNSLSK